MTLPELDLNTSEREAAFKWKYTVVVNQKFWHEWSIVYLKTFQAKHRWSSEYPSLQINELELLIDQDVALHERKFDKICEFYPEMSSRCFLSIWRFHQ